MTHPRGPFSRLLDNMACWVFANMACQSPTELEINAAEPKHNASCIAISRSGGRALWLENRLHVGVRCHARRQRFSPCDGQLPPLASIAPKLGMTHFGCVDTKPRRLE